MLGSCMVAAAGLVALFPGRCMKQSGKPQAKMDPPKRPPGQPKPLLDEDIAPVLARLDAWYEAHLPKGLQTHKPPASETDIRAWNQRHPPGRYAFNPPATDAQIDAFERVIGIKLSRAYRQLYRWHDGDDITETDTYGHIYGLPLLSLRHAESQWKAWGEVLNDKIFAGNRYWSVDGVRMYGAGWPAGAVDPAYINRRWIPLTHDWSGNHIGLDYDPWPAGRIGQVIIFGRDEDVKVVLAESLGKFLGWIADLLESGNFRLDSTGEERLRLFRLKNPPADHFHEGARRLLGAPGQFL